MLDPTQQKNETLQFTLFLEGNEQAFEYFFKKYNGQITGFCRQFLYDEDKAASTSQEAFINLWLNREHIQKLGGIKSFLYTSARSKCLNILKHEKVSRKYHDQTLVGREQQLNMEVLYSLDFDSLTLVELEDIIQRSIEELPEKTRTIFTMKRIENKKNAEIAADLGVSQKAVEAHMTKAIKLLREKLSDYLPAFLLALLFQ